MRRRVHNRFDGVGSVGLGFFCLLWIFVLGGCGKPPAEEPFASIVETAEGELPAEGASIFGELLTEWQSSPARLEAEGRLTQFFLANDMLASASAAVDYMCTVEAEEPKWFFYRARHEMNFGDPVRAAEFLDQVLLLKPGDLPTMWDRAQVAVKAQDNALARDLFERMCAIDPKDPYGYLGLARLAAEAEAWDEAEAQLKRLRLVRPEFPPAYFLSARILQARGEEEKARLATARGNDAGRFSEPPSPWRAELFAYCVLPYKLEVRGATLLIRGDARAAREILTRAVEIDPARGSAYFELGKAFFELVDDEACLAAFEKALGLQPQNEQIYPAYAEACIVFEQSDRLEKQLREALDVFPDFYYIPYQLGLLAMGREHYSLAIEYLRRASELESNDQAIWAEYAESARMGNSKSDLLAALDGLYSHFGEDPEVLETCGTAWIQLGEWDRVEPLLIEAVEPSADSLAERLKQAAHEIEIGRIFTGLTLFQGVLQERPGDSTALYNLGSLRCRYFDCESGLRYFEQLQAVSKGTPRRELIASLALAQAAVQVGRAEKARGALKRIEALIAVDPDSLGRFQTQHDQLLVAVLDLEGE